MAQEKIIDTLESTIVTCSLLATKPINDAWSSITGECPISWKSNLVVRSEMLWFFLLMMERYALEMGSQEARATLQDAIVENAIQAVLIAAFDTTHVKKGFDVKKWQTDMASSALEEFNEAATDYDSVKVLVDESPDLAGKRTILGRLSVRIARQVEQQHNPTFLILISTAAAEGLVKSELKKQVEKACKILR